MFAGLMGLECGNNSFLLPRCDAAKGGRASETAGGSGRRTHHRRPGYMRGELSRPQDSAPAGDEDDTTDCFEMGRCECGSDGVQALRRCPAPTIKVPAMVDKLIATCMKSEPLFCNSASLDTCGPVHSPSNHLGQSSKCLNGCSLKLKPASQPSSEDCFQSSFSFIQQSLTSTNPTTAPPQHLPAPGRLTSDGAQTKADSLGTKCDFSNPSAPVSHGQTGEPSFTSEFWQQSPWSSKDAAHAFDGDSRCLDTEAASSVSVDSDTASGSSLTSGYESTSAEQGWDSALKKYEGVLQDCLQSNRTHSKIESMMLKLQKLQQRAILDDDYDTAERFGKKLDELNRERAAVQPGLPSTQPTVSSFLERLKQVVHSALRRTDCGHAGEESEPRPQPHPSSVQRKERLMEEKHQVEEQITELQHRLQELKDHSRCLEQQIQQEEQRSEDEELQSSLLKSCTPAQLRDMSRALQELFTSESRSQIFVRPVASTLRLQEKEQALSLSIREATAKVVMSQRLGSSLRRKVSETEAQLLTMQEAKLAAIAGNDFSSAKELKAEIKAVCVERERLEALTKRLHNLSSGSNQELTRMKEEQQRVKQELGEKESQHEKRLKENTTKYMELLKDRLHSCGCSGLERIWEADLEACHLILRNLQQRTPDCSGGDTEDGPADVEHPLKQPCSKEEEDCAMLTALGGRWCPGADLQNSQFTKKLEEFLFCVEENHSEGVCSEPDVLDLTEHCELIGERLVALEEELQTAILSRDQALTQSLEKEVQEVKSTLQSMFARLTEEEEGEEEEEEDDLLENDTEEEEDEDEDEEEDQYFSDSWEI